MSQDSQVVTQEVEVQDDPMMWLGMPEDVLQDLAEYTMSSGWAG
jgi:hypothetical protein